jgi:plasmid stabilization system protein ParE
MVILPLAKNDIKQAAIWYNAQQFELGKRFTQDVRNKVSLIRKNPLSFAVRYDNIRTVVLDIFPFMIHYSLHADEKTILISAVLHTSRNPNLWLDRK